MKKYLLSLCVTMLAFVGSWAQTSPSVTKNVSADGKTVTYTCVGDVSSLENSVVTGYTFNQAAVNAPIYKENRVGGSTVTDGEQYYSTGNYYAMSYTYSQANIPTVDGYILKQIVYQFDGTATYALKASGTGLAAGGSNFYSLTNPGTAVADMSTYLGGEAFSNAFAEGLIWECVSNSTSDGWQAKKVTSGMTFNNEKYYFISEDGTPYNKGIFYIGDEAKEYLVNNGYLGQMVSDAATTIYAVVDGTYTKAAGTVYNSSATYVDGVEFSSIADVYTETYTENTTTVSTGSDTYYTINDGEYVVVVDGSVFTGNQADYFKRDANPTFSTISQADLLNQNYLDPVMGTANYWAGVYNEIKANSYENVILESDGGEKAIINSDVIRYLLWGSTTSTGNGANVNKAIKKLNLGDVECPDLCGESWMILDGEGKVIDNYAAANFQIQELTLPLTKDASDDYVVPTGVLQYFAYVSNYALTSVVIPHGYTAIADHAFISSQDGKFGDVGLVNVEKYTIPSGLKKVGDKAFYGNTKLTQIDIPSESFTEIGQFAFAGCENLATFEFPGSLRYIGAGAFDNDKKLSELNFNPGLLYIGNSAFYWNSAEAVPSALTFPSSIEYIGPGAFYNRFYGDIYFTGEHNAPACPIGPTVHGKGADSDLGTFNEIDMAAWSANTHMGNNGFLGTIDGVNNWPCDNPQEGYANRDNYVNGSPYVYFTMLHFPAGVSIDEAKTYKDVTRHYVTGRGDDGKFYYGGEVAIPGAIETDTKVLVHKDHGDRYWPAENEVGKIGIVAPGYEDTYLGAQKIWPSQSQWMRAYTTVANGVEWDGGTEYRPEVTAQMLKWMIRDGLNLWIEGVGYVTLTEDNAETYDDYLSMIAYQSTRRFVLADDGSRKGDDYEIEMKGQNWWTIVFPFSMTKKQVDDVFGKDTHVCLFSGVDRNAEGETKHITLKFQNDVYAHSTPVTAYKNNAEGNHYAEFSKTAAAPGDDDLVIKAFESYMIFPTKDNKDAATFKIENPKIEQGSPWPTVIKSNTEIENRNTVADWADEGDHTEYRFVGNLLTGLVDNSGNVQPNTIPQYSYVYAKKKNQTNYQFWFYTGTTSAWKVNKSVVQATAKDGGAADNKNFFGGDALAKQVSLFGADEEETTEIEDITIMVGEGENAVIYNISGQRIAAPQKGLYIKNGKKYISK